MTQRRLPLLWLAAALGSGCGATPERAGEPLTTPPVQNATQVHGRAVVPPGPGPAETSANVAAGPEVTPVLDETAALLALAGSHSTSSGAPGAGTLISGVALPKRGPGFLHNDKRPPDARYGTVELVQSIARAAAAVERELPGIPLVVNDLSLSQGGPIAQHGSHQSGRDADILFYTLEANGEPLQSVGVPLGPDGKGWDFKQLSVLEDDVRVQLDARRTWRFVQGLIDAGGDQVQRIFIVEHVRALLLAEAERVRAPQPVRDRFADITCQPGTPHDDHMHVRFFCSPEDISAGCFDKPPIYPWHAQALLALGLAPVLERVKDRAAREEQVAARTTTPEQARKRAGPMHPKVRRFLAERAHWIKPPKPGRRYCR